MQQRGEAEHQHGNLHHTGDKNHAENIEQRDATALADTPGQREHHVRSGREFQKGECNKKSNKRFG